MANILPVPPFLGGLQQPQCYPTRGRKNYTVSSSIKQRPLVVASWNVRTLQDTGLGARRCTVLIACELARDDIGIAATSETKLPDEGSLVEMGLVTHFSGVAYPQLPAAFMVLDLQLGLRFCRAPRNPPLQYMSDSWHCGSHLLKTALLSLWVSIHQL